MQQAGCTRTQICHEIGKDKSVLSRELKRNCDRQTGMYNPELAEYNYQNRLRNKPKFIYFTEDIKQMVISYLNDDYSPEQIVGRAKLEGKKCVSHETIYQFVWNDKKAGGKLHKHLRNGGKSVSLTSLSSVH
jgi:IS30 family transposase